MASLATPTGLMGAPSANARIRIVDDLARRLLGAYYTPRSAADYMADWIVRHDGERVLEPSFGDGIFLRAVATSAARKTFAAVQLLGVEIDERAQARALHNGLIADDAVRRGDFLGVSPFKVQAVIGNPPYVRLRQLPPDQRERALNTACIVMGHAMDPSGSLWLPFILHAMRFLDDGGRLAFVLPYELTYVRYARPLWKALRGNFGSLHVLRTHERLFPELLQDVVILLADGYGARTDTVRYQAFERVDDLLDARPVVDETLDVDDLVRGERAFVAALLGDELRQLLRTRVAGLTVPARKLVTFNIGYVAGDKEFFHPTGKETHDYRLPTRSLRPALTSTRALKGAGLCTSSLDASRMGKLFLPDPGALAAGERRYIATGAERGVAQRYKCRVRDPWFVVPGTHVPDIVLSVFSERPALLLNDAGYFASNSLLCGYRVAATGEEFATGWYTSLTLLQCELEVHALGGGVMVLVPREAGNVRLPKSIQAHKDHLDRLDQLLRLGEMAEVYCSGDRPVLIDQLGLNEGDVELIRHGIAVLTHWRTSARASTG
jgi:adenine-specific DNA-methyltransferase